jgi:hypothetical protein
VGTAKRTVLRGEVNLPQEETQAGDERQGGAREEQSREELQLHVQQDLDEQRGDHHAHEERGEGARGDGGAREVAPPVQALQLDGKNLGERQLPRRSLGEVASPVDDPGKTSGHDVQDARDACQQENRGESQLYGTSDVVEMHGCVEHGTFMILARRTV